MSEYISWLLLVLKKNSGVALFCNKNVIIQRVKELSTKVDVANIFNNQVQIPKLDSHYTWLCTWSKIRADLRCEIFTLTWPVMVKLSGLFMMWNTLHYQILFITYFMLMIYLKQQNSEIVFIYSALNTWLVIKMIWVLIVSQCHS